MPFSDGKGKRMNLREGLGGEEGGETALGCNIKESIFLNVLISFLEIYWADVHLPSSSSLHVLSAAFCAALSC